MDAIVDARWREERRDRILDAAAVVFSRQAFPQASMDDVALEAGVGKPTLYRYFGSKDALFGAVFEKALDQLEGRLARVLCTTTGARQQLTALISESVPMFRDHLVFRLVDEKAAAADRSKRRIFRERRARIGGYLAAAIESGIRAGEVREVDPDRVARLILGTIWSASASSDDAAPDVAAEVIDLIMLGLTIPTHQSSGRPTRRAEALGPAASMSGEAA